MRAIVTVLKSSLISLVMVTEGLVCFLVVGVYKYIMLLLSSYSPQAVGCHMTMMSLFQESCCCVVTCVGEG